MPDHFLKLRAPAFLRHFAEDVVVIDREGAPPRTVRAVVDRLSPAIGPDGKKLNARAVIEVMNDGVKGIASSADLAATRVRMAIRLGGEVKDWTVAMEEGGDGWADAGMVRLSVR